MCSLSYSDKRILLLLLVLCLILCSSSKTRKWMFAYCEVCKHCTFNKVCIKFAYLFAWLITLCFVLVVSVIAYNSILLVEYETTCSLSNLRRQLTWHTGVFRWPAHPWRRRRLCVSRVEAMDVSHLQISSSVKNGFRLFWTESALVIAVHWSR